MAQAAAREELSDQRDATRLDKSLVRGSEPVDGERGQGEGGRGRGKRAGPHRGESWGERRRRHPLREGQYSKERIEEFYHEREGTGREQRRKRG